MATTRAARSTTGTITCNTLDRLLQADNLGLPDLDYPFTNSSSHDITSNSRIGRHADLASPRGGTRHRVRLGVNRRAHRPPLVGYAQSLRRAERYSKIRLSASLTTSPAGSRNIAGNERIAIGRHRIAFRRASVTTCAFNAVPAEPGFVSVEVDKSGRSVEVTVLNRFGVASDTDFHLMAVC